MRPSLLASVLFLLAQCGRRPAADALPPRQVPPPATIEATCTGTPVEPPQTQTTAIVIPSPGKTTAAESFSFSADLSRIVATRADGAAFVVGWGRALPARRLEGTPLPQRPGAEGKESFSISADGRRVVGGAAGKGDHGWEIRHLERVWDATTGAITSSRTVVLSGQRFASTPALDRRAILASGYFGDAGYSLHLAGVPVATAGRLTSGTGLFHDAVWSPSGDRLAVTRARPEDDLSNTVGRVHPGTFAMWRLDPPAKLFERAIDDAHIGGFIGDGALVVVRDGGRMHVLDAETGRELRAIDTEGSLLASPRRDIVVTASSVTMGGKLEVYDLASGDRRRALSLGRRPVAIDPTGHRVAINGGGRVCVVDVDDGRTIADLALPLPAEQWPQWSADGRRLVTWGEEGALLVVDLDAASVTRLTVAFGAP